MNQAMHISTVTDQAMHISTYILPSSAFAEGNIHIPAIKPEYAWNAALYMCCSLCLLCRLKAAEYTSSMTATEPAHR